MNRKTTQPQDEHRRELRVAWYRFQKPDPPQQDAQSQASQQAQVHQEQRS